MLASKFDKKHLNEEGQKTHQPKHQYNNKGEDNSPKTQNDKKKKKKKMYDLHKQN